jgi:quinol monooxygenase YgiN
MIIRIVRMTFLPEKTGEFLEIYNKSKNKIRHSTGCHHLELWQDIENPNVFSTYSLWDDVRALETYKQSEFFRNTWRQTKVLFAEKPLVQSYQKA